MLVAIALSPIEYIPVVNVDNQEQANIVLESLKKLDPQNVYSIVSGSNNRADKHFYDFSW